MKAYECKRCQALVVQVRIVDDDGRAAWWYRCRNQECGQFYGRPVLEKDLEYLGTLDGFDPGLKPWSGIRRPVA